MSYQQNNIGDILITFDASERVLPARSISPWREVRKCGNARVLITEADAGWRGFPLRTYPDDRWNIWALGEFYETQPDLPQALETSADLNGHFLILGYEKDTKRWHILTDRFGTIHAYHAGKGQRVAIGTFSPSVAAAASAKALNWGAITGFFKFGFFLGDTTYWHDLHVLKPATHTILDQYGKILTQHRTWAWYHQPHIQTNEDALETFKDLFHQVLWEEVRGKKVAVPISGGLDSRSTLIPLSDKTACQAADLFHFSYGYGEESVETAIAKKLADKRDLDLTTWSIQTYLFDKMDRVLAASEGFQDLTLSRQAYVVDQLSARATHVLAAHWMDVWLDDMGFLDVAGPLSDEDLALRMVKKFTKNGSQHLLSLFKDWPPANHEDEVKNHLVGELGQLNAIQDMDFKVKAWKTWAWSFRWTLASLRTYQAALFPLLPFYDHRLADFFCQMPSKVVRGRRFQIDYLKHYGPDLARVPWQPYDANLYTYEYFNSWLIPKRAFKKLGRVLSGKKIIQRNWEVQFLNDTGRAGLVKWLLTPGLRLHDYLSEKELEAFLNKFYEIPDAGNGYTISMLLTFSAWLEAYG